MAELEGFFAKKDKKKSKPKKFVPEEMAQMLEEAEQKQKEKDRREELERERLREEQLAKDDPNHKKETDEWQEEVEVTVDLSDLNIKELPQPEEERAEQTLDADGNPTASQAVWTRNKGKGSKQRSPEEPVPEPVKPAVVPGAAVPEPAKPAGGSGYVPPHRRNMPAGSGSEMPSTPGGPLAPIRMGSTPSWRTKKAPDISSDDAFPTLGSAVEETARGAWGRSGRAGGQDFQRVRHGNTSSQDSRPQASKLRLGNQFDALQTNDC